MIPWHRLFGIGLTDLFTNTDYRVDVEKDLSLKKQLLDTTVVELEPSGEAFVGLDDPPDGLEDLGPHNLFTYKSVAEPLNDWTMDELLGHFVNYRKVVSPGEGPLVPVEAFRLFAVCTRFPQALAAKVTFAEQKKGVYNIAWGVRSVRVIVLSQVPTEPRNALWAMFSAVPEHVIVGTHKYRWKRSDLSGIMRTLYARYKLEGFSMSYTVEDFKRDLAEEALNSLPAEEILKRLSAEERLRGLPPEERLRGLPPEERLRGLPPEERLRGLPPEERLRGLPPEERFKGLSREEILAYVKKLEGN